MWRPSPSALIVLWWAVHATFYNDAPCLWYAGGMNSVAIRYIRPTLTIGVFFFAMIRGVGNLIGLLIQPRRG